MPLFGLTSWKIAAEILCLTGRLKTAASCFMHWRRVFSLSVFTNSTYLARDPGTRHPADLRVLASYNRTISHFVTFVNHLANFCYRQRTCPIFENAWCRSALRHSAFLAKHRSWHAICIAKPATCPLRPVQQARAFSERFRASPAPARQHGRGASAMDPSPFCLHTRVKQRQ